MYIPEQRNNMRSKDYITSKEIKKTIIHLLCTTLVIFIIVVSPAFGF